MPATYAQALHAIGDCVGLMAAHGDIQSVHLVSDRDYGGWSLEVVFFDRPASRYIPQVCHGVPVVWRCVAGQYTVEQHGSVVLHTFSGRLLTRIKDKLATGGVNDRMVVEERWDGSLPEKKQESTDAVPSEQPESGRRDQQTELFPDG